MFPIENRQHPTKGRCLPLQTQETRPRQHNRGLLQSELSHCHVAKVTPILSATRDPLRHFTEGRARSKRPGGPNLEPISNRFRTDFGPISDRFRTDFGPISNRFRTNFDFTGVAGVPQGFPTTDFEPILNRFRTDFEPISNRFRTDSKIRLRTGFEPLSNPPSFHGKPGGQHRSRELAPPVQHTGLVLVDCKESRFVRHNFSV